MASKRQRRADYAEDSYTDEEDEMDLDHQEQQQENRPRVGRPRKASVTTSSSTEAHNVGDGELLSPGGELAVRRRGRGPSKRPCLNRNALMARENRQRKKEYIERIENRLQACQKENSELNATIKQQNIEIKRLTSEVTYLKTVLNNKSHITSLLQAMNESLRRMHGSEINTTDGGVPVLDAADVSNTIKSNGNGLAKSSVDVLNWVNSGQKNSSKTNNLSLLLSGSTTRTGSEVYGDVGQKSVNGQMSNPVKVAKKAMPFNNYPMPKIEGPSSVESIEEDDKKRQLQKSLPQSGSICEYQVDNSPTGLNNLFPTTPMSALSNSLKNEASLSDTDFSQLSSFNVDLFENFENEETNPLQFEQNAPDLFNEDTLFHTLDREKGILDNNSVIDPEEISKMSDALKGKTLFNTLENIGVCLHINSSRVSLEYCSICHLNSLNNMNSDYM